MTNNGAVSNTEHDPALLSPPWSFGGFTVGAGAVLKNFWRIGRHPWIGARLARLEWARRFPLVHQAHADGRGGKIHQLSLRLTDRCNLRCRTCGQWGDHGFLHGQSLKSLKEREVPPARWLEVMTDLVSHGHRPIVYLWGGEPMLYEGVLDLIAGATEKRLPVSIATNGTRMAECAELFVKAPLFLLQVSIDGHCADLHNRARPAQGNGNSFDRILEGLAAVQEQRKARRSDLPLIASLTVISSLNFRYLPDIYENLRSKVDLFVFYLSWWIDEEHARKHEEDFSRRFGSLPTKHWGWIGDWKPDDYKELSRHLQTLLTKSRRPSNPPVILIPPILGSDSLKAYYTRHQSRFGSNRCTSIFMAAEVNSNGDVSPCRDYSDYVVGNIKEANLTELWNGEKYRFYRKSLTEQGLMPVCSRCCGLLGY